MSAAVFLITGPVASGKTSALVERYRAVVSSSSGTALWLAPTDRARDAVLVRVVAERDAQIAPNVATFPDLARLIARAADPATQSLPEFHQRLLLDDVLADLHTGGQLTHFGAVAEGPGFAEAAFRFLTELKGQGVTPAEFARTAAQVEDRGRAGRLKDRQIAGLFAQYQERLAADKMLDRATAYHRAAEAIHAGRLGPFVNVRAVFVDGFADFTPPQLDLLAALCQRVDEVWVTLVLDHAGRDDRSELFQRPLATLARLERLPAVRKRIVTTDAAGNVMPRTDHPDGLSHLERQLFKPPRTVVRQDDATGLTVIEAPGLLGEVRLVARGVKRLLLNGTAVDAVLLTARDLAPYADVIREVFGEYGIPLDIEGTDPLARCPAVGALLRAARVADDGFSFASTTAVLRNTYVRPAWTETEADPDVALHAEVLLRMLGEPRGRDAYLRAVARWSEQPEPPLEDEQAEESRRQRQHALAKRCRAFLERFLHAWDGAPEKAPLAEHAAWLRGFADDLGLSAEAAQSLTDAPAWGQFWEELDACADWDRRLHQGSPRQSQAAFLNLVTSLAAAGGVPRTPRGPGRVRAVSAEQARHLDCDYLFLLGMGERSFPALGGSGPLYDDGERQALRTAGLDLAVASDRLPDEMLLFYQLVTRPRRCLTFSYPAVDEKGQALLPSSFLTAVRDCFTAGAISVHRQRMLIEGFDRLAPLSPAEYRVRWAAADLQPAAAAVPDDLANHLAAARDLVRQRFHSHEYSPYDGLLRHPTVLADLGGRFGPAKVFSATALESFVACPFQFFLDQVLKLEPLDDPAEEVEQTRRGAAVHRALSRLHQRLHAEEQHLPTDEVGERLTTELTGAIEEYAARVSSPAAKALWRLEGRRLGRAVARYQLHWKKYLTPWQEHRLEPRPHRFEVDFGLSSDAGEVAGPLVLNVNGVEVRIGGRIDRIDIVDLPDGSRGFWVIDYKTGRAAYHTAADLQNFQRLQLTLYALAVERVLLVDARPLGLAYWMVAEKGPKVALPEGRRETAWLASAEQWQKLRGQLEMWVAALVGHIRTGTFPLRPRSEHCTDTCSYGQVCRIAQSRGVQKEWELPLPNRKNVDE